MVKVVIQFMIGKMPVNKMGISFQSCRMITALMLMSVRVSVMAMLGFRMIMNERKQKERNNDPKKEQFPPARIFPVHSKSHNFHAVLAITYISESILITLNETG